MTYITAQEVFDRFSPQEFVDLTNLESPSSTSVRESALEIAIVDASSEIDSYLCGAYPLPLTEVPSILKRKACDLVRYYLEYKGVIREQTQKKRDEAIAWLEEIAAGTRKLGLSGVGNPLPSYADRVDWVANERVFSAQTLCDY